MYAIHGDDYESHVRLQVYKGSVELIVLTNGANGGAGYFGLLWGIVLGNWFAKMAKSKGLMIDMSRKGMGL